MQMLSARRSPVALETADLPCLTDTVPLKTCQVCIGVPVRDEAARLPHLLQSLTHQIDEQGQPLNPDRYEILILANNCRDDSVAIAQSWAKAHPALNLHVIAVTLPPPQASIGYARRLLMNEAYRRLAQVEHPRPVMASTDGDTEVAPNWIAAMLAEFDQGVEVVCGRILTRRSAALGISAQTSLYFLRYMGHRYLTAQLEALLDPLPHDRWPRHYQHFGANLAVLSELYGRVGGIPAVPNQEDVAFYRRLRQLDAKIRHSPRVRVVTSARRVGRTSGGLAERLNQLTQAGQQRQAVFVEAPALTEARIRLRYQLRQLWLAGGDRPQGHSRQWQMQVQRLAPGLGLGVAQLQQQLTTAPTFGLLLEAVETLQRHHQGLHFGQHPTVEISLANMHLRQRLQDLRQQRVALGLPRAGRISGSPTLEALQQVQPIPLFSLTY